MENLRGSRASGGLLVLAILAALPAASLAGDKFVSALGSDSNSGDSAAAPYATIQKGLAAVAPGGTVWIAPGSYAGPSVELPTGSYAVTGDTPNSKGFPGVSPGAVILTDSITINSASSTAVVSVALRGLTSNRSAGASGAAFTFGSSSGRNLDSVTLQNCAATGGSRGVNADRITGSLTIDKVTVDATSQSAAVIGQTVVVNNVAITGSTFGNNGDGDGVSLQKVNGARIDGNAFARIPGDAIVTLGTGTDLARNILIQNNVIRDRSTKLATRSNTGIAVSNNSANVTVKNNLVVNMGQRGIHVRRTAGTVSSVAILDNTVFQAGSMDGNTSDGAGIQVADSTAVASVTIRYNLVANGGRKPGGATSTLRNVYGLDIGAGARPQVSHGHNHFCNNKGDGSTDGSPTGGAVVGDALAAGEVDHPKATAIFLGGNGGAASSGQACNAFNNPTQDDAREFRLPQAAAGQAANSPAVDAGNISSSARDPADALAGSVDLSARSTRTDGAADGGLLDLGYHFGAARNTAPVAADDDYSTAEDTVLAVAAKGVLANDTDAEGDALAAALVSGPSHGTLSLASDGSFLYTPAADFNGSDSFVYRANDGKADSGPATVTITVNPVNDAPVASGDAYGTAEDTALSIPAPGVLGNDSDADGNPLAASLASGPAHGTLSLQPDGSFLYAPAADYNGPDSFAYKANDGSADSNAATVALSVEAVNDAPVAQGLAADTEEDAAVSLVLPATDADGDALTFRVVSAPSHGRVSGTGPDRLYAPDADYHGPDSFTFVANDGAADSNLATVSISVGPVNDAPMAFGDAGSTGEDSPLSVAAPGVLGNDADADGDVLAAALVSGPSHGALSLAPDGAFTYTPAADFHGSDSFAYKASDGTADSNVATVSISVNPVNDAPVASGDAYGAAEDAALFAGSPGLLGNDTDADGDALSASLVSGPAHGTLSLAADGSFDYTPGADFHGEDSFTYRASDGLSDSEPATVTITVDPVNDPPAAAHDLYVLDEDAALSVAAPGPLGNDSDVDGDALSASLVSGPSHGTLSLGADGSLAYSPAPDFHGIDSFAYQANDGSCDSNDVEDGTCFSNIATVTLSVNPVNDAPAAGDDAFETGEDAPLRVPAPGLLANDTDVDVDALSAVLVDPPAHGALALEADGSFAYTPGADFHGEDAFTYQAGDGSLRSAPAAVRISVASVNDPPVAFDDAYSTDEDTILEVAPPGVLGDDADADGDPLAAILVSAPAHGSVVQVADGSFTYTPGANFHGEDAFTYKASDGAAESAAAMVVVTVRGLNDAPVTSNDAFATDEDTPLAVSAPGVLGNDTDADGDALSAVLASAPAHGSVAQNADGSFAYTPAPNFHGADAFTYKANDGWDDSDAATVSIEVRDVNDAPAAANDAYTTNEDTLLSVGEPGVLGNDTDADGDARSAVLASAPAHGTVALASNGSFTYAPAANFNGADSFTYRAGDGSASSAPATVAITVRPAVQGTAGKITGGGSLDSGVRNFGLVAQGRMESGALVFSGNLEFQDKGRGINVKGASIALLQVSADGKRGFFTGTATVNGASGYTFRVDAEDVAEPGALKDTFRIRVQGPAGFSYDSQPLATRGGALDRGGNIQVRR